MKLRKLSLFLAAVLALSTLASCGDDATVGDDTTVSGGSDDTTDAVTETYKGFPMLEDRNFKDEVFDILIRRSRAYEFVSEEETAETVPDAVYKRNTTVEEKYNCELNFIQMDGDWGSHENFANNIHNSVFADDGAYDMVAGEQSTIVLNIVNEDFMNIYDIPNIQPTAPWWSQEAVTALTRGNACYVLAGDVALSLIESMNCMYFNKKLATDYKSPDFYELVRNGEWTHDKLAEVTKGLYKDINNNDTKDEADFFGLISPSTYIRPTIVTYDTPTIDPDGKLVWNTEHTISVVEKLVDLFATNDVIAISSNSNTEKAFSEGRALLINGTFAGAARLRSMEDDFGIIPYPKFDKDQESYKTTSNSASMFAVPITTPNADNTGFILEALCRESTDTVAEAFYEVALQSKYTRDDEAYEMIQLIRNSLSYDFGWLYSMATTVSGNRYELMATGGDKNFSSWYAENESSIEKSIEDFMEIYAKD